MFRNIIVLFFALNALFWGLFPHEAHCTVASAFKIVCPPHWVHLIMGILSFLIAVLIAQWGYVKYLTS
jgi:hypothetical protein